MGDKIGGSTVVDGKFKGCPIKMKKDIAYIDLGKNVGKNILLSTDDIKSYWYRGKDSYRQGDNLLQKYYLYEVTLHDGSELLVRMRNEYRNAMIKKT